MALEIDRMLVLSTGHLTEEACNTWLKEHCPWACFEKGEFGYFMFVPFGKPAEDEAPECIRACLIVARSEQAAWIMFDRDGPIFEGLPQYEW